MRKRTSAPKLIVLSLLSVIALGPMLYTFLNSFSGSVSYGLLPVEWSLQGWKEVFWNRPHYLVKFWNSLGLSAAIVAGQVLLSCLAGYGFSKFRFRGKEVLFFLVILLMMMPYQVTLVSNYLMLERLRLIGSQWALILPAMFSPFGVFLLRQVFDTCPNDLLEAARLDGAGNLRILFGILVPRCRAGVISLGILSFIDAWNMVEQPIVFLKSEYDYPLSVFLTRMRGSNIGVLCTCGVLAALPVVLLFLYYDQELTEGVTLTQL
ncbi:MAG: carbohydrate ABC transporter permease [Faecousia sp.]